MPLGRQKQLCASIFNSEGIAARWKTGDASADAKIISSCVAVEDVDGSRTSMNAQRVDGRASYQPTNGFSRMT